ncbi:hypothetical protein SEEGA711_18074 [Salmonella enterica subsp. enterica serovar Gaminara str. ATCC BAA-711]|nr:hypothetical protein SEEGA711_18074 [Salmonella enterica subsp. enterica serovar Gaminara str. ATCC BAA-711]
MKITAFIMKVNALIMNITAFLMKVTARKAFYCFVFRQIQTL